MKIPPHIARWALDRERQDRMFEAALRIAGPSPLLRQRVDRGIREIRAEPVSTAIGLTALIASAGVSAAAAGAIGGFIITVGASFAISAASQVLMRQNRQSALVGGQGAVESSAATLSQSVRTPQVGPIPEQRLLLGQVTSAGIQLLAKATPPYIYYQYLLASHRCGEFLNLFMRGANVPLDANGEPLAAPFFDGTNRYLKVSYRPGTSTQELDPIIAADFPDMPSTFRQRGSAVVTIRADYGATDEIHRDVYGTANVFNPLFRVEGATYIDLRRPGCLIADENTWVNGETASLNFMRAMYHSWPDMRLLDPGKIDWDRMNEAAEIDDRRVGLKDGGTEANHTCSGIILSNAEPLAMIRELLTSCDGLLIGDQGKYYVISGAPRDPVGTIDQDMLAGGYELHTETPNRDLINTVKTEFVAPDRDWKPVVGPILKRSDLVVIDGKPLETTLTLPYTQGDPRAQRLGARKLNESRGTSGGNSRRRALSLNCNLLARNISAGSVWRVYFRDFPWVNGVYQVMRKLRDETATRIQLELVEFDNSKYDWHAPSEQQDFALDEDVLTAEAA